MIPERTARLPTTVTELLKANANTKWQKAKEKDTVVSLEPTCQDTVRAMKCGGGPTQPTYHHHRNSFPRYLQFLSPW